MVVRDNETTLIMPQERLQRAEAEGTAAVMIVCRAIGEVDDVISLGACGAAKGRKEGLSNATVTRRLQ